jgi:pilus assembly protein CpaB
MRRQKFLMAVVIGIIAIFVATNLKPKAPKPKLGPATKQVEKVKEIEVYVAKVDLKKGTRLNETNVKTKKKPETKVPVGAVTDKKELEKKEVTELIKAGEIILESKLKPAEEINRLSDIIPKGLTAMTIRVDDISGVGGFIKQGDYVDVVGIFGNNKNLPFKEPVKTILVGVKVLTIGYEMKTGAPVSVPQNKPPSKEEGPSNVVKAKKVPHVTIAVTPEEAEILTLVADKARLRLLLRSSKDGKPTEEEKEKAMSKEIARLVSGSGSAKVNKYGYQPPNRGRKLSFSGNVPSEIANDPKFKSLFGSIGNEGLTKVKPSTISSGPTPTKRSVSEPPKEYRVEVRKGTQPPSTITVKD